MIAISIKKSDHRGFTLIEVAIALFLIATALLAVFRLQAQNLKLQSEADFATVALHLAQDRMANLQGEKMLTQGVDSGDFDDPHENFSFQTEISKVIDRKQLYRIRVSIFQRQNGFVNVYSVETHLYR